MGKGKRGRSNKRKRKRKGAKGLFPTLGEAIYAESRRNGGAAYRLLPDGAKQMIKLSSAIRLIKRALAITAERKKLTKDQATGLVKKELTEKKQPIKDWRDDVDKGLDHWKKMDGETKEIKYLNAFLAMLLVKSPKVAPNACLSKALTLRKVFAAVESSNDYISHTSVLLGGWAGRDSKHFKEAAETTLWILQGGAV